MATRLIVLLEIIAAVVLTTGSCIAEHRIELPTGRIRLADLAAVLPQTNVDGTTVLGYAPLPGVERRVRRAELVRWLRSAGSTVDPDSLPESIVFARRMRRLGLEEVRQLLVKAIAVRHGIDAERVAMDLHSFAEPLLPDGKLDFELGSGSLLLTKPATLAMRWSEPGGSSGILSFRATTRIRGSYAVARAELARGTEISRADFELIDGDLPGDLKDYDISADQLVGQELTQALKAGQAIGRRFLRPARAVKRGDLIEIRVMTDRVVLRAPARAEDSGSPGDVIRCRNLQSGTTVRAVVVAPREAEVASLP